MAMRKAGLAGHGLGCVEALGALRRRRGGDGGRGGLGWCWQRGLQHVVGGRLGAQSGLRAWDRTRGNGIAVEMARDVALQRRGVREASARNPLKSLFATTNEPGNGHEHVIEHEPVNEHEPDNENEAGHRPLDRPSQLQRFGIGTDICAIHRISALLYPKKLNALAEPVAQGEDGSLYLGSDKSKDYDLTVSKAFLRKLFNPMEMDIVMKRFKKYPRKIFGYDSLRDSFAIFVAGRFAAKEAIIKAIRSRRITFHDITILPRTDKNSRSMAPLALVAGESGKEGDCTEVQISISHDGDYATATCLAVDFDMAVPTLPVSEGGPGSSRADDLAPLEVLHDSMRAEIESQSSDEKTFREALKNPAYGEMEWIHPSDSMIWSGSTTSSSPKIDPESDSDPVRKYSQSFFYLLGRIEYFNSIQKNAIVQACKACENHAKPLLHKDIKLSLDEALVSMNRRDRTYQLLLGLMDNEDFHTYKADDRMGFRKRPLPPNPPAPGPGNDVGTAPIWKYVKSSPAPRRSRIPPREAARRLYPKELLRRRKGALHEDPSALLLANLREHLLTKGTRSEQPVNGAAGVEK